MKKLCLAILLSNLAFVNLSYAEHCPSIGEVNDAIKSGQKTLNGFKMLAGPYSVNRFIRTSILYDFPNWGDSVWCDYYNSLDKWISVKLIKSGIYTPRDLSKWQKISNRNYNCTQSTESCEWGPVEL